MMKLTILFTLLLSFNSVVLSAEDNKTLPLNKDNKTQVVKKVVPFTDLLNQIKANTNTELLVDKNRKKWFLKEKTRRSNLLDKAQQERDMLELESENLKSAIDENEQEIAILEAELQRKLGDLGELFGVVRQVSGELQANFEHSIVSIHYPNRVSFMQELSEAKDLPEISVLEKMWLTMLNELDEGSKVSRFNAPVVQLDGTKKQQEVVRVGSYIAVSEGDFLLYAPENNMFEKLFKQPSSRYHNSAENFDDEVGGDGFVKIMVDPTRGQLLNMLTQKPNLFERVNQGGIVGYIILILGFIGLSLAAYRYYCLTMSSMAIDKQIKNIDKPTADNPLGRIAIAYADSKDKKHEQKETLIEEAIMKEVPVVERYNTLIKLLAAVSPLLGLLGTVTGMIITFQSITLFGTSDPKLMAGGISTALVTTVLGLSVAIPLLFAYTFIVAKTKRIIDTLEHQAVGLIAKSY